MTKNTALADIIKARVKENGPITFKDFMQAALYEPGLGYYSSGKKRIGRAGDFYTSPTSTPLFGSLIARWLAPRLRELGKTQWHLGPLDTYTVLEIGSGTGALKKSVVAALRREAPDIADELKYVTCEFDTTLLDGPNKAVIISNELLDAFPVHRVRMTAGGLRELYVDLINDELAETEGPPSTDALQSYLDYLGINLPPGFVTEINLRAVQWVKDNSHLHDQFMLTIDYGYESDELYAPYRSAGTIMGYYKHQYSEDPFAHIGEQDLTSHVNFSALMKYGETAGLKTVSFTTQSDFLIGLGAMEMLEELQKKSARDISALKSYLALKDLIMPDGFGGVFKVLEQKKTNFVDLL